MPFSLRISLIPLLLAAVTLAAMPARGADFALASDGLQKESAVTLVAPAIGRPAFVRPGQAFTAVLASTSHGSETDALPANIDAALIAPRGGHRYPLDPGERSPDGRVLLHVPPGAPAAVYDLSLRVGDDVFVAPHSVAVRATEPAELRVALVDPLRLGSPEGAEHLDQFAAEINLTGADVVVLSGPFVSPLHPAPEAAWADAIRFIRACEAPVITACGSEDWNAFTARLGTSPTGAVQIGPLLMVLLGAPPGVAAETDGSTREWLERTLAAAPPASPIMIVSSAPPAAAPAALRDRRAAALWYASEGSVSGAWSASPVADRSPNAATTAAASPQVIFAGPPGDRSSTGGYRVIDISADGARGWEGVAADRTAWIPQGSLSILAGASTDQIRVVNRLAMPAPRLAARLRTPKRDEARPWVEGGTLVQLTDAIDAWECRVRFDAPARTATCIRAGVGPAPAKPALTLTLARGAPRKRLERPGIVEAAVAEPGLELRSSATEELSLLPVIRAAGREWAYAVLADDGDDWVDLTGFGRAHAVILDPGVTVRLRLEPAFARLPSAAQASVQVYCFGSDTVRPLCLTPVDNRAPRTQDAAPPMPPGAEPGDDVSADAPAADTAPGDEGTERRADDVRPASGGEVGGGYIGDGERSEPNGRLRPVVRFGGARAARNGQ